MPSVKKMISYSVITLLLVILGLGYLYWFHFQPIQDRVASLKMSLENEEQLLSQLESAREDSGKLFSRTTALQQKVPVAPLLDQFILDLEKAEISSGSRITSFTFNENQGVAEDPSSGQNSVQENTETNKQNAEENIDGETAPLTAPLPEGIERLSVSLTVEAPSYFELEAFIKAIEDLPRISKVDSLTFAGNREVRNAESAVNRLVYSVTVSTFYYPKLAELRSQLPQYETPPPADKINPLYPSGSVQSESDGGQADIEENIPESGEAVPEEEISENDQMEDRKLPSKIVNKNGQSYLVYTYHVQAGDTFFRLAMEYYDSREGEQILKEWNGISRLLAGTTIEIPIPNDGK